MDLHRRRAGAGTDP